MCCLFTRLPANESPALSFPGQWETGRDTTKPADRVVAASAASQSVSHSRTAHTVAQCRHGPGQQRGTSRAGRGRPSAGRPTSHTGRPSRPRRLTSLPHPVCQRSAVLACWSAVQPPQPRLPPRPHPATPPAWQRLAEREWSLVWQDGAVQRL